MTSTDVHLRHGCARNPMADPGVFGDDCPCWCHINAASAAGSPRSVRQRKEQADRDMRLLLAYAREHVTPRPYRLADLAEAAGMSISGVRSAYRQADIDQAAQVIGADGQRHIQQAVTALLAHQERQAASGLHITAA